MVDILKGMKKVDSKLPKLQVENHHLPSLSLGCSISSTISVTTSPGNQIGLGPGLPLSFPFQCTKIFF